MTNRSFAFFALCLWVAVTASAAEQSRFAEVVTAARVCASAAVQPPEFAAADCETRAIEEINPQGQILWLGATVDLPAGFVATELPVAVYIGALASSEVYWNGELIGTNGVVGSSGSEESPGKLDAELFVPTRVLAAGANQIAIRMASFHNVIEVSVPVHYLYVASAQRSLAPLTYYYAPALLTAGAFVLAAVYFGFAALADRQRREAGFIAALALFAGIQLFAESLRAFVDYAYPWQVWRLIAVTLCATGFALTLTAYLARRFRPAHWRSAVAAAAVCAALAITFAPGFDFKAVLCLLSAAVLVLLLLLRPALHGVKGARPAAVALAGFVALIVIDPETFLDRGFFVAAALLTLVLFVDQAREMQRIRAMENETRSRADRLELELLRRRIAPHFLMNTLNALTEWVESEPATGVRMIDALAEEFRLLSLMSDRALVPLFDEIALCRRHLEVMSFRVDREFALVADEVDGHLAVPPGVIHTLVENAFTHGRFADGAEFRLSQSGGDGRTTLTLTTPPGDQPRDRSSDNLGSGLAYVTKRLEAAFGASAEFSDGPGPDGGWVSRLSFAGGAA